jgi:TonB family protein
MNMSVFCALLGGAALGAAANAQTVDAMSLPYADRPKLDYNPATGPLYPPESVTLKETGEVRLAMCVSWTGSPQNVVIVKSSGFPRLDAATLEWSTTRMRLSPALIGGKDAAVCNYQLTWVWSVDAATSPAP